MESSYPLVIKNHTPKEIAEELIRIIEGDYIMKGVVWNQNYWIESLPQFFKGIETGEYNPNHTSKTQMKKEGAPSCGTAACVAGHAVMLAGYVPHNWSGGEYSHELDLAYDWSLVSVDGKNVEVSDAAQEVLGLSYEAADYLFSGDRTEAEVLVFLKNLVKTLDKDAVG